MVASMCSSVKKVLGMGNPLLDISANVSMDLVNKYELKMGDQILADKDKHLPLYDELANHKDVVFVAGGATQNSIRIAQWLLSDAPGSTSYMGAVGKDKFAETMNSVCKKDGVDVRYMVNEEIPTGTCAVCVNEKERSLVANLGAAETYKQDHLESQWDVVEKSDIFYSAGFFITSSAESIEKVAMHAFEKKKIYCMNLSAPFICQVPPFKAALMKTMPYIDYLFGNETEAAVFAETEKWDEKDLHEIAKKISLLECKKEKARTVVITQGDKPTIVAQNGKSQEFPIIPLSKDQIVDTNGAGDAYVGGFLAELAKGSDIEKCCKAGAYASSEVVQRDGCTFPEKPKL